MAKWTLNSSTCPIIYVRGYAGSAQEIEDTVADPYMGFNIGSTKIRQVWGGAINRHYFESPLVRLMKDFGYKDVYTDGAEMPSHMEIDTPPIVIYRYYDPASRDLGTGEREEIESYARGLETLILGLRDRVCGENKEARRDFRVYLVAHSMGGLICRSFLQNVGSGEAVGLVDKVFTYATPHNGIDLRVIGNVPGFFTRNNANNFDRDRMKEFLGLPEDHPKDDVSSLNGKFDPDRFFCLIGTNDRDYGVGGGIPRMAVGPMSDGLVRIKNAAVWGWKPDDQGRLPVHAPRAYVHRSHSGHYGIVNSEDGYQNLIRFLFGDLRVDGWLEVHKLRLPPAIQRKHDQGQTIHASYHFEAIARVRGASWDLYRRTVEENSAVFRKYDELFPTDGSEPSHPFLVSSFLAKRGKVVTTRASLGFCLDLGVLVPEYEVEGRLWLNDHYDGGYLFRDKINLEAIPPGGSRDDWRLKYGFDSRTPNRTTRFADGTLTMSEYAFRIPIRQKTAPGIDATLVIRTRPWH